MLEWTWFGKASSSNQLEPSTNLSDWSPFQSVSNATGVVRTLLPITQPKQFFRLVPGATH